jgi:hypothetical protein
MDIFIGPWYQAEIYLLRDIVAIDFMTVYRIELIKSNVDMA